MVLDRGGSGRTSGGASLPTQLAAATTPYRSALVHRRLAIVDGAVRLPSGLGLTLAQATEAVGGARMGLKIARLR